MLLAECHLICSEKLVDVGYKPLCAIPKIYGILCFELSHYLLRQYIVKGIKLVSSAGYIYGTPRITSLYLFKTE